MALILRSKFERRRYNRISVDFDIFLLNTGKRIGRAINLSHDGILFETEYLLKPGNKLLFDFKLPDGNSSIKPYCDIRWVKRSDCSGSESYRVGVYFAGIYEYERDNIRRFIEKQVRKVDSDNLSLADYINISDNDLFKKAEQFWEFIEDTKKKKYHTYETTLLSASKNRVLIFDESINKEREVVMMGSSNYLGLTTHSKVIGAANEMLQKYGTGTGSIRLLTGTNVLHRRLERVLADLKGCDDALVFPTGHMANLGCISALNGKKDIAIVDKRVHASILDGCMLGSGSFKTFRHSDTEHLRQVLESIKGNYAGKLIVLEGVDGIDGDLAPLPDVIEIANEFGAKVMLDDAHATGVIGDMGRGTQSHFNMDGKVDVVMDSLSKALGGLGGYIASSREVVRYLKYYARTSFFSVSAPPVMLSSALAAIQLMESDRELIQYLWKNINYMKENLKMLGFNNVDKSQSAIISTIVGNNLLLRKMNKEIFENGVYVEPLPYPAVGRGQERLRMRIMASHTKEDLDKTLEVLEKVGEKFGVLKKPGSNLRPLEETGKIGGALSEGNRVVVYEIRTKDKITESIKFSWKVYKDYPQWVPYFLIKDRVKLLSGDYHYFRKNVLTRRFIVKENDEIVGTVSAFADKRFIHYWKQNVGFLGFFDALPGHSAAIISLIETAIGFLKSQGLEEVWAPVNVPFVFYGAGILSNNFDKTPSFLQPYNPEYYKEYFEKSGFNTLKKLPHFAIDLTSTQSIKNIDNIVQNSKINIRKVRKSAFDNEARIVLRILNESFPRLWNYVLFEDREFIEFVSDFKDLIDDDLWLIAEVRGEPLGFVGAFPQCAKIFKSASGELESFDLCLVPQELQLIREGAIVLLGVIDKYRHMTVGLNLLAKLCSNMIDKGYRKTTCTWEISDKGGAKKIIEKIGGKEDESSWTIFRKTM
ncbi:aminotransferase class I/II-fold pyridoxal phosphate-dependent enzyme [Desulfobacterota bacterium AH_259_B03_O07]|nr:aminotransferase class I/II-fold pyridoxal phosphate-dependent enzyme [Desulfobacterota bacterium AH_259_B03_O07]